jgi:pimeloyl-ACP methyl ester carboxylesterase
MLDFYSFAQQFVARKMQQAGIYQKQLSTNDFQIDYWDNETEKPCIFLLNGFGANSEFQWFKQVSVLKLHYRVVVINLLYFGNSKPINKSCFDISCQIKMIESLRMELGLNKVSIAGISYGGLIATEYAQVHESNVKQLFLVDAAVKFLTIEHLNKVCEKYKAASIEDFFAPDDYGGLKRQLKAAYHKLPYIPNFVLKAIHKKMCAPYTSNWLGLIQSLRDSIEELSSRHYNFNIKTILFWGKHDEIIPLHLGEKIAQELKASELHILQKSGHMPNLEEPKRFNDILLKVVEEK